MAVADNGHQKSAGAGEAQIERTRERLIDAALEIIGRKGFADARVEDICQTAGSARATFYRHFSSKEEMLGVLLDRLADVLDALVTRVRAITPDGEGYATLRRFVAETMTMAERWAPVMEALNAPGSIPEESRRRPAAEATRMSTVLGRAIADGGGGYGDPWMEALALTALVEGFGHQVRTWDISLDRDSMIDTVTLLSLRMLHPALEMASVPATTLTGATGAIG